MTTAEKRYAMVIDLRRCIGCHACSAACKMENSVPEGAFRSLVKEWDKGVYPEVSRVKLPILCNHCADTPCISDCPTEATYAVSGGAIVVNEEDCIGCGICIEQCPYEARYINQETKKAEKCTFCIHRVEKGLMPSCVSSCISHARFFGDLNNPDSEVSKLLAEQDCQVLKADLDLGSQVYYIGLKKAMEGNRLTEVIPG
ncbi:4Fe-4S dicluster domain-containing protein [Fuchsiella alkaliacetigena]|uniref:4Fe-4S dicluster domain-containing protein n=1 Tax=Fuchsiella alkaliacetigena TaxID=957042 RepID=UPI00200B169C|nr:4Fe-4S dicluster domain-containing protein [Fuchsiella alkaliacetigena]MCK8823984.1 4Fe-4S dicluster domain-containing protein [Fuchsiella alkaliacetigena]